MAAAAKLSLVAQFDDLVRNNRVLQQGIETEFERFVRYQEQWRQRMVKSEQEKQQLKQDNKKFIWENSDLRKNIEMMEERLKVVQVQLEKELQKHKATRKQKENLERQVEVIREVLNAGDGKVLIDENQRERLEECMSQVSAMESPHAKYGNLTIIDESGGLLDDEDIDYDTTGENILEASYLRNGKTWKRSRTNLQGESPDKKKKKHTRASRSQTRHRRSRSSSAVLNAGDASASAPPAGLMPEPRFHSTSPSRKTMKKYNSDSTPKQDLHDISSPRGYGQTPLSLSRHNSGNLDRPHIFLPKRSLKRGECCSYCGKAIGFFNWALKCNDCRAVAHERCKDDVPLPCAPVVQTPGKNIKSELAFYAPVDPPCIPGLIVHCVKEIEQRGLKEQGLYRVPGSEKEVKELKDKFFKGKGTPMLSTIHDINVVCGCLKAFLKDLKEPLVTYDLWRSFTQAVQMRDKDEGLSQLYQAVSQLPRANRDTLAYLVQHLHRVAESPETKMNVDNLSRVFGPTFMGFSSPDPEATQAISETQAGIRVVSLMMEAPQDYWNNFLDVGASISVYPPQSGSITRTPDYRGFESMLGPIDGSNTEDRPWLTTPRNPKMLTQKGNFFQSPVL